MRDDTRILGNMVQWRITQLKRELLIFWAFIIGIVCAVVAIGTALS